MEPVSDPIVLASKCVKPFDFDQSLAAHLLGLVFEVEGLFLELVSITLLQSLQVRLESEVFTMTQKVLLYEKCRTLLVVRKRDKISSCLYEISSDSINLGEVYFRSFSKIFIFITIVFTVAKRAQLFLLFFMARPSYLFLSVYLSLLVA